METATLVTFIAYPLFLTAIGLYSYRKNAGIEDYLLGGRRMGDWVRAQI